jgi:site-specific recombinase XerD
VTDPHVEGWLNEIDADTTRRAYERDMAVFTDWLDRTHPDVPLPDADRAIAGQYAAHIRRRIGRTGQPLADSSRARMLSTVSSFYRYLVQVGEVDANPFYEMKRPKVSREGRTPARSDAEVDRMWRAAADLDLLVVALLASSGLRVTELCRADVKDLATDHEVRVLSVRTKGGGRRNVPLPPVILDLLTEHIGDRTTGPLLVDRKAQRLTRDQVAYILRRVARRAGLSNPDAMRPHVLRASAITNLLEKGRTTHDVQAMVGHASADTTTRYWRRRAGIARDLELVEDLIPNLEESG